MRVLCGEALRQRAGAAAPTAALGLWGLTSLTTAAGTTGLDLTGEGARRDLSLLVVVPALTLPLLARRRHAGAVFLAVAGLFAARVVAGLPPSAADFAVPVAAFAVGRYGRRRDLVGASVVAAVPVLVAGVWPFASLASGLGLALGCVVAPVAAGLLTRAGDDGAPGAAGLAEPVDRPGSSSPPDLMVALSGREREVLDLLARGWSNQRIADHLHIEVSTVKSHVRRVLQVLGARNRVEAAASLAAHGRAAVPQQAERPR